MENTRKKTLPPMSRGLGLQPGEDPRTAVVDDALHWLGVYIELERGAGEAGAEALYRQLSLRRQFWRTRLAELLAK